MWSLILYILIALHPLSPCDMLYDGIDISTNLYKKEMRPQIWWRYTPPQIKNSIQEENLITTSVQLVQIEKKTYLNLNLELYTATAAHQYGEISQGTQLIIHTISGRKHTLQCRAGSAGIYQEDSRRYLYPVSYEIPKGVIRALLKSPVDKVGLQWASGYEEYTVYEVALLQNQLECLNQ